MYVFHGQAKLNKPAQDLKMKDIQYTYTYIERVIDMYTHTSSKMDNSNHPEEHYSLFFSSNSPVAVLNKARATETITMSKAERSVHDTGL